MCYTAQVTSFGDVFCQSYEVYRTETFLSRDKTRSAGEVDRTETLLSRDETCSAGEVDRTETLLSRDKTCSAGEVDQTETLLSRDKTCSAGLASGDLSLSEEMFSSVRRWLDIAESQLSAAAEARMNANADVTRHNVQPLFAGLSLLC